jgi:hypothetical protein
MLNALFGSEARVKILNLFLLHPESKYYINQIALDLKLAPNSVRKEMENILQLGLIIESPVVIFDKVEETAEEKRETKKNKNQKPDKKKEETKKDEKKYFEINKNFILYPEIKALFIKAQILSSQKFISTLEKSFQPKLLILTGFFTNYPEAQTDLLIVGSVKRPPFLKLITDLEKDLGHEINFTILEEKEFKYRQEIMDIFLYNILEGKTVVLIDNFSHK